MSKHELEEKLVRYCAPTLAGIKTANLFQFISSDFINLPESIGEISATLNKRGVFIELMLIKNNSALIYVYRKSMLIEDLKNQKARNILNQYGYNDASLKDKINFLRTRLAHYTCFPHEIGLFLGYPPEDVEGFIKNKGNNCKVCGFWKVYCNEKEACCLFDKIKKSTSIYVKNFSLGRSLEKLTVNI